MIQPKSEECDHIKFLIEEKDSEEEAFYEDLDGFEENGTQETRISPYTFCKAFPFHLMFDKDLMLTQCGNAIYRVLPQVCLSQTAKSFSVENPAFVEAQTMNSKSFCERNNRFGCCVHWISISGFIPQLQPGSCILPSVFSLVRPHIDLSFYGILSHINTVFVLRSKVSLLFTHFSTFHTNTFARRWKSIKCAQVCKIQAGFDCTRQRVLIVWIIHIYEQVIFLAVVSVVFISPVNKDWMVHRQEINQRDWYAAFRTEQRAKHRFRSLMKCKVRSRFVCIIVFAYKKLCWLNAGKKITACASLRFVVFFTQKLILWPSDGGWGL